MKHKLLISLFLLFVSAWAKGQDRRVHLIDPIVEPITTNRELSVIKANEIKDWGWNMVNPLVFHNQSYKGEGVIVFIIDTGVDRGHEDLKGKVLEAASKNFRGGIVGDQNGHGSWCASRIASPENGLGVIGIAPNAILADLSVLDASGSGSSSSVAAAYRWAADVKLPAPYDKYRRITSASLGSPSGLPELEAAVKYASSKGVINIVAAGNEGYNGSNTIGYPGRYDAYCITVAACDQQRQPAYFSSGGNELDVTAPGVQLLGAYKGSYAYLSGTSMATPCVAGLIALIVQKYGDKVATHAQAESYLKKFATDLIPEGEDVRNGAGLTEAKPYYNNTPDGTSPEPPIDTTPTPPTPVALKQRILSVSVDGEFTILYGKASGGKFRFANIAGLLVEYTTTETVEIATARINKAVKDFYTNRGFVLPDDQFDTDFAAGWAEYFMQMILKQNGLVAKTKYAWVSEVLDDGTRNLIYYDKSFPVSLTKSKIKKEERSGRLKTFKIK